MLNVFQVQNRQTEPEGESDRFCRALTSTNCNQLELDNTPQRKTSVITCREKNVQQQFQPTAWFSKVLPDSMTK